MWLKSDQLVLVRLTFDNISNANLCLTSQPLSNNGFMTSILFYAFRAVNFFEFDAFLCNCKVSIRAFRHNVVFVFLCYFFLCSKLPVTFLHSTVLFRVCHVFHFECALFLVTPFFCCTLNFFLNSLYFCVQIGWTPHALIAGWSHAREIWWFFIWIWNCDLEENRKRFKSGVKRTSHHFNKDWFPSFCDKVTPTYAPS